MYSTAEPPRVHVAILTHNALEYTKRCLASLARNTSLPHETWIVDNASVDGTQAWLRMQSAPNLHVDFSETNLGVPGGRNRLLAHILPHARDDDFVVFLDNDIEVGAEWTTPFVEVFCAHPEVAVAGRSGHLMSVHSDHRVLHPRIAERGAADVVSGGFACWVRIEAARAIGGFDEKLGLFWHEDDDFCLRAIGQGFEVFAVPDAPMVHHEHASGVALPRLATGGSLANQRYLARKWRELGLIDEDGWVVRRSPWHYLPPPTRRDLARRLGQRTPIDRHDLGVVQNDLFTWLCAPDPAQAFQSAPRPLIPLHFAVLDLYVERARSGGEGELIQTAQSLRRALQSPPPGCSRSAELRARLRLPGVCAAGGEPRLSKLCNTEDWEDPAWLAFARELFGDAFGAGSLARHRAVWEPTQVLSGLEALGVLRKGARVLAAGPAVERLVPALARRAVAVEVELPVGGAQVDVACWVGPLEGFGDRATATRALAAIAACLRPGGVMAIATNLVLDGSAGSFGLSPKEIIALVETSDLRVARGPIDFAVSDATLEAYADERTGLDRLPHLVVGIGGQLLSSIAVFLQREVAQEPEGTPDVVVTPQAKSDGVGPAPHVGIDVRTLYQQHSLTRGIGHYTLYHLNAVIRAAHRWRFTLYGWERPCDALEPLLARGNVSLEKVDAYAPGELDLFHVPDPMNLTVGFDSPLRVFRERRTTVTFYDLIPLRIYWPRWSDANRKAYLDRLGQIRERECGILAISEFTRTEVLEELSLPPECVHTVHAGINSAASAPSNAIDAVRRKFGLQGPFFLHVGALDPHKNFTAVLTAFLECRRERDCQLVVVGKREQYLEEFARFCAARRVEGVVFTDFVTRAELEALYETATALVLLSRYEGFGFPVLEAMARGCPVIASNAASIPEVTGDAALLVPPDDRGAAVEAMRALLAQPELRADLHGRGRIRAVAFQWEAVADRTLAVWKELLGTTSRPAPRLPPSLLQVT